MDIIIKIAVWLNLLLPLLVIGLCVLLAYLIINRDTIIIPNPTDVEPKTRVDILIGAVITILIFCISVIIDVVK